MDWQKLVFLLKINPVEEKLNFLMSVQPYSPPPVTVAKMVTASYAIPGANLMTILWKLAKAKQTIQQLKKNAQVTQTKEAVHPLMVVLGKLTTTPMPAPTKMNLAGKRKTHLILNLLPNLGLAIQLTQEWLLLYKSHSHHSSY